MKKFPIITKHPMLTLLVVLVLVVQVYKWFTYDECSPENKGPFDGKVLYSCTVEAVANYHRGNKDPSVRAAWLHDWSHHFDNSNLLRDEKGTLKAITEMLMSMNERFDYFYTPEVTRINSINAQGQIAGIGAQIEFTGTTPGALDKLELPEYPTAQAIVLLRDKFGTPDKGNAFEKMIVAVDPEPGTPAFIAGLKAGDRILEINGHPVDTNMDENELIEKVRGPVGSRMTLKIETASDKTLKTLHMVRQIINLPVASAKQIGDVGVVKIDEFESDNTPVDVHAAVDMVCGNSEAEESATGCKSNALIVDLRNNRGGRLDFVLEVAQLFVDKGNLATVKMRNGNHTENQNYLLTADNLSLVISDREPVKVPRWTGVHFPLDRPIVVLVNEHTASGAEALAEMLHTYRNAIVVGKRTVGKGVGQCPMELPFNYSLNPICMEYAIGDRSIDWVGVSPDVEVATAGDSDNQLAKAIEIAHNPAAIERSAGTEDLAAIAKQRKTEFKQAQAKLRELLGL
jgi:C-terminal peptidase prc